MKYGICLVDDVNGNRYVTSTKGRPGFSFDISDIALFVQKDSAAKALKRLRLDGAEEPGTELCIVEVEYIVANTLSVDKPAPKPGFFLLASDGRAYFRKKSGDIDFGDWWPQYAFAHINRASVFTNPAQAEARQRATIEALQEQLVDYQARLPQAVAQLDDAQRVYNINKNDYWYTGLKRDVDDLAGKIERYEQGICFWQSLKVEAVS